MRYSSGAAVDSSRDREYDDGDGAPDRLRRSKAKTKKGKRKPKAPLWTKLCIAFGLVLALGSAGTIGGVNVLVAEATKSVTQENLLGGEGAKAHGHASINGPQNILLLGLDNRPGQDPSVLVRADSIIILHIPASHDAAYLISIPRDTYVHIPAFSKTGFLGQNDKINSAFAFGNMKGGGRAGGVELMAKTINELYGISFNAAAIVDFEGFQQVVKVLGGVDMYVDQETISAHIGHTKDGKFAAPYKISAASGQIEYKIPGVTPVVYKKGYQHLLPWQALDFVRQRELLPNGDYDRERHQQQFIKAIFKEILSKNVLFDTGKLTKVLDVVGKAMTVDTQGVSIPDWIFAMKRITSDSMVTIKTNKGTYHAEQVGNQKVETLDANTVELLAAVKADTVGAFVVEHPDLVASSDGT